MKKLHFVLFFVLFTSFSCFAQLKVVNKEDYRFVIDQTPFLKMQYPKRNDIPEDGNVFYALSYDRLSYTAFIYNEYVCGYFRVPKYLDPGFRTGARNLQCSNPQKYNNDVEMIMERINEYWRQKDSTSIVNVVPSLVEGTDDIYSHVEEMPRFVSGVAGLMGYLGTNIKYPNEAEKKGIHGRVVCSFVVMEDGSITNIAVEKSIHPLLDSEAIRVVSNMPKWIPGKQNGIPKKVKHSLPITFRN